MPDINNWIPEKIRQSTVAVWLIGAAVMLSAGAGLAYTAVNATTLSEMKGRIEGLNLQNQRLTDELRDVKERYEAAVASRNDDISKKVSEVSVVWRDTFSTLTAQYEKVQNENRSLRESLATQVSQERQRTMDQKQSRLSMLNDSLTSNSKAIALEHQKLYETSGHASSFKTMCEGEQHEVFANACQQAAKYDSDARSIRENITSLEKYGDMLNAQILALEGRELP